MRPEPATRALFDELAAVEADTLVSVAVPTHQVGGGDEDRLRLKNALGEVDAMLADAGWRTREREAHLEGARSLLVDAGFWQHQRQGLLVYVDPEGRTRPVTVGRSMGSLTQVGSCYHVRHLLGAEPAAVPVLVLTLGGVALYESANGRAEPVDADLPASFDDVNWFLDREAQLQRHASSRGGGRTVRHGHDPADRREEDVRRFLRAVDSHLPVPTAADLVVVGDARLVAGFADVSGRPVSKPEHGGIDDPHDARTVADRAEAAVAGLLESRRARLDERVAAAVGSGSAVTDTAAVARLAVAGLVSELFVDVDAEPVWGRFVPGLLLAGESDGGEAGDVDLVDRAVVHATRTGARVEMVTDLDQGPVVAVPRAEGAALA